MSTQRDTWLERVYHARSAEELETGYDGWAGDYDADLASFGYRIPAIAAGLFGRHVPAGAGPVLDAGCGTGLIGETLNRLGYGALTGIDLSEGMLAQARRKGVYAALHRMKLGGPLDLPDDHFAATTAIGVLTAGHARPDAFDELIRATRPGGAMIFSIRVDTEPGTGFQQAGKWQEVERTEAFQSMPSGEPEVLHRVFVYRIL
jgi:predicted TPR repeat methyltransferase